MEFQEVCMGMLRNMSAVQDDAREPFDYVIDLDFVKSFRSCLDLT